MWFLATVLDFILIVILPSSFFWIYRSPHPSPVFVSHFTHRSLVLCYCPLCWWPSNPPTLETGCTHSPCTRVCRRLCMYVCTSEDLAPGASGEEKHMVFTFLGLGCLTQPHSKVRSFLVPSFYLFFIASSIPERIRSGVSIFIHCEVPDCWKESMDMPEQVSVEQDVECLGSFPRSSMVGPYGRFMYSFW